MHSPLQEYLDDLIEQLRPLRGGEIYAPTASVVAPDLNKVGITLTTVNGHQYSAGDYQELFAIQSISKTMAYGMALEDLGSERVLEKIDVEPSGEAFHEISLQEDGRPDNPMINAGAIATTGLIKGRGGRDRMGRILHTYAEAAAGSPGEMKVSEAIFKAEDRMGHRNRALAWMLRSAEILETDPEPIVQDYFRQCAVQINTAQLSMMAATLANRGVNPLTDARVFSAETVRWLLSVMSTCGMYDDAGNWAIEVGLPAKSGVGGGLMVVVPGQLGIGFYSPELDQHGTSLRGAEAIKRLTRDLGLHYGESPPVGRSTLRAQYSLSASTSGVIRPTHTMQALEQFGETCQVIEISGDLGFAETETLVRTITDIPASVTTVVLDLRAVDEFGKSAIQMLSIIVREFLTSGRDLVLIDEDDRLTTHMLALSENTLGWTLPDPREQAKESVKGALDLTGGPATSSSKTAITPQFRLFHSRPRALEWTELRVLQRHSPRDLPPKRLRPTRSPLFAFMAAEDVEMLTAFMDRRRFKAGQVIRRSGQPFAGIYFVETGRVEMTSQGPSGRRYRPVFLSAGMTFGEIALGRAGRQLTTVRAVDDVTCLVLTAQMIASLEETDPHLAIKLWTAMTREAYTMLEQASREAGARHD